MVSSPLDLDDGHFTWRQEETRVTKLPTAIDDAVERLRQ